MARGTKRKSHREKREVQIIAKKLKYDEVYFIKNKGPDKGSLSPQNPSCPRGLTASSYGSFWLTVPVLSLYSRVHCCLRILIPRSAHRTSG